MGRYRNYVIYNKKNQVWVYEFNSDINKVVWTESPNLRMQFGTVASAKHFISDYNINVFDVEIEDVYDPNL